MALFGSGSVRVKPSEFPAPVVDASLTEHAAEKLAILAGGCFWCTEAVFTELAGVLEVTSGYAGDEEKTANYEVVCSGRTNHAEVVEIRYDASKITFGALLRVFFSVAHDPTQYNRQGNDTGRQYRSAVFYADAEQHSIAEAYIRQLDAAGVFSAPIVTRLEPLEAFFKAEAYHQGYAALHPGQPYIASVALPKVEKLKAFFGGALKDAESTG